MTMLALASERAWLDRRLGEDLRQLREAYELAAEEFRGLWVSDDLIDARLRTASPDISMSEADAPCPISGRLQAVRQRFALTDVEIALLILGLAAEIDSKYESIFAYLNGLVTRRWPTFGLAARLFSGFGNVPQALAPSGVLMRDGLLTIVKGDGTKPETATEFRAAPGVIRFVNGLSAEPPEGAAWLTCEAGDCGALTMFAGVAQLPGLVLLEGFPGSGQEQAVSALAAAWKRPVLDVKIVLSDPAGVQTVAEAMLLARLENALLLVRVREATGHEAEAQLPLIMQQLSRAAGNAFIMVEPNSLIWQQGRHDRMVLVAFDDPKPSERARHWRSAILRNAIDAPDDVADRLASRFRLGPGEIADAAAAARLMRAVSADASDGQRLFAAARDMCGHELARLAKRIRPVHGMNDLVLPSVTSERVRAVIDAVANCDVVHREWGLADDGRAAGGIAALFQGPSGTGKTMTASVVAAEAGLDLYRIDLSSVVSKYIGETEKNLETIFRAARRASAILMFDEADAIFGKRAEVKDAHDRYANIEVAYLLQRIEEHDGPVILATNLAKNIDQAFARRLNYIIEFPRPSSEARVLLWQRMLRQPVPLADDVDFEFLGRQFELTGGEIRKAALEAAYMAAGDGRQVRMRHLMASAIREARRQGRMPEAVQGGMLEAAS